MSIVKENNADVQELNFPFLSSVYDRLCYVLKSNKYFIFIFKSFILLLTLISFLSNKPTSYPQNGATQSEYLAVSGRVAVVVLIRCVGQK